MDANTEISRVAIVGTGLIGGRWAACFLAHGLDVVATDPAPGTEDKVRQYVEGAWAALTKIGLAQGASTSRLRFTTDLKEAIAGADLVQENGPEREALKIKLFADMDSILPPPAILVSSTSGIAMSFPLGSYPGDAEYAGVFGSGESWWGLRIKRRSKTRVCFPRSP